MSSVNLWVAEDALSVAALVEVEGAEEEKTNLSHSLAFHKGAT